MGDGGPIYKYVQGALLFLGKLNAKLHTVLFDGICILYCTTVDIMSESPFSRQILIKFARQLNLGPNGIPLFFSFFF